MRLLLGLVIGVVIGAAATAAVAYWVTRSSGNPYQQLSEQGVAFASEQSYHRCTTRVIDQARQNRIFTCFDPMEVVGRHGKVRAAVIYQGLTTFEKGAAPSEIEQYLANSYFGAAFACISGFRTLGPPVEKDDSVLYLVTFQYRQASAKVDGCPA